jgi:putative ABC transport system ATP-binding protein
MSFIRLKDIIKEYETAHALRGVSMEVEKRQWVNIMGPTSGDAAIDSTVINRLSENDLAVFRREKIGFVTQQSHLIPYLNSVENVMMAQYFHSMADEKEAVEALARVGLEHRLYNRPSQLSGGEQQRICIARALINSPELLLADEPTGNLDRENTVMILELLKKLHNEEHFTIVLVTHDPFVSKWGQRILTMEDGMIRKDEAIRKS